MAKTKKKSKDYADKETDKYIELIEKKIKKVYSEASKEMEKKFNSFVESFSKEDKEKLNALEKIEDDDEYAKAEKKYLDWRQQQLFKKDLLNKMSDTLSEDLVKADQKAMSIVNGYLPDAYALNYNFATYDIEQNTSLNTSFTLYSRETVERLAKGKPQLLPKKKVDVPKDKKWNRQHLKNEILQGVLQGKSIPDIATGLQRVTDMDRKAAIRNARTMMTGAQNGGRMAAYDRAANLGVNIQKEWMATLDTRTRDSHQKMDGERVDYKKAFSNDLMFPGDPQGDPSEVYNCRCTMVPFYPDYEYEGISEKRLTYSEWLKEKEQGKKYTLYEVGNAPKRPARKDYITAEVFSDEYWKQDEKFQKAREEYRKQMEEYKPKIERFVSESLSIPSMTIDGMQKWCKENNVNLYGDISKVDGKALTAFTRRTEKLLEEFPMVKEYRKKNGYMGMFNVSFEETNDFLAEASTGFTFGRGFTNFENVIRTEIVSDYLGECRVLGDGTVNQIFDHEFGHNLYNAMKYNGFERDKYDGLTFENLEHIEKLRKDLISNVYGKEGISEYATTNDEELFAEAFSAWHGGEKTEFAKAMGDFLKKYGVIK